MCGRLGENSPMLIPVCSFQAAGFPIQRWVGVMGETLLHFVVKSNLFFIFDEIHRKAA
jgi:hypothetical protein